MLFFGLGTPIYVAVLLLNAITILSEDRFLARIGWGTTSPTPDNFGVRDDGTSIKSRLIKGIAGVRTAFTYPLIGVNTLIILYELLLG